MVSYEGVVVGVDSLGVEVDAGVEVGVVVWVVVDVDVGVVITGVVVDWGAGVVGDDGTVAGGLCPPWEVDMGRR